MNSKLILIRGISGSGKSVLAKKIKEHFNSQLPLIGCHSEVNIFGTDDLFMENGEYQFDPHKLKQYHEINFKLAAHQMWASYSENWTSIAIMDNTNTTFKEMAKYIAVGLLSKHEILFSYPDQEWSNDPEQAFEKNQHGVPLETIRKQFDRFESHDFVIQQTLELAQSLNVDFVLKQKTCHCLSHSFLESI